MPLVSYKDDSFPHDWLTWQKHALQCRLLLTCGGPIGSNQDFYLFFTKTKDTPTNIPTSRQTNYACLD